MDTPKPTMQMYSFVQDAYDFFNDKLFAGELPPCLLTLQREKTRWDTSPRIAGRVEGSKSYMKLHLILRFSLHINHWN